MLLRRLARNGRTVITTIHSPSAEILDCFDRVLCLCYGEVIYDGEPRDIPTYFTRLGFAPPPLTNPADHLMTIIHEDDIRIQYMNRGETIPETQVKELFQQRIDHFVAEVKKSVPEPEVVPNRPVPFAKLVEETDHISYFRNFFLVLQRTYLVYFRNPAAFRTKMVQAIGFSVFAMILFQYPTDPAHNTARAIADIGGIAFFMAATNSFAGIQANVWVIIFDLPIFKREFQNKLYGASTFYLTHALFEIPLQFLYCNIYLLLVFWSTYMRNDSFLVYLKWMIMFLCVRFSASGVGDVGILIFKNIATFNQGFTIMVIPLFLVSGFIANVKTIAIYMIVYSYLSFFRFGFQAGVQIAFDDGQIEHFRRSCRLLTRCGDTDNPDCYAFFGNLPDDKQPQQCNPLTNYDFYEKKYVYDILILIAQGLLLKLIAYFVARGITRQRKDLHYEVPVEFADAIASRKELLFKKVQSNQPAQPAVLAPRNENRIHSSHSVNNIVPLNVTAVQNH